MYQDYYQTVNSLFQLKSSAEQEINELYSKIKTNLIDTKRHSLEQIIDTISKITLYRNRYTRPYLSLFKKIYDEYHPKEIQKDSKYNFYFVKKDKHPKLSNKTTNPFYYLIYKEYGILLNNNCSIDVHEENTIFRAIMDDEIQSFISFTESEHFDRLQHLTSPFYPCKTLSLLELCCYHGAVKCFKFLRTTFKSIIFFEWKSRHHE